jgi:alginate O-acetyltransferase complex protein AlgI
VFGTAVIVLCLVFFKYINLIISTINSLGWRLSALNIIMPLGISFFIFEFIHYLADIYAGKIKEANLVSFLSFSLFFPSLISGPIKRYENFNEQIKSVIFKPEYLYYGIIFILLGYSEKYLLADNFIPLTAGLSKPEMISSSLSAIKQLYFYSFRIYFDFSAMSFIAIGSALLLGISIPKNFNYPYISQNISEFWNRWHISLSQWIRDYLYIPLGGNRSGFVLTLVNSLVVMAVCGLWHGASWNFMFWGLWHGLGLSFYKIYKKFVNFKTRNRLLVYPLKAVSIFLTFNFVTLGWVFFVTPSLNASWDLLTKIF